MRVAGTGAGRAAARAVARVAEGWVAAVVAPRGLEVAVAAKAAAAESVVGRRRMHAGTQGTHRPGWLSRRPAENGSSVGSRSPQAWAHSSMGHSRPPHSRTSNRAHQAAGRLVAVGKAPVAEEAAEAVAAMVTAAAAATAAGIGCSRDRGHGRRIEGTSPAGSWPASLARR